jgi:hypothetical protein
MRRSRRAPILLLTAVGAAAAFSLARWTRPAGAAAAAAAAADPAVAAPPAAAAATPRKLLTKHEDQTFENQTVYVSGQAFIRCKFNACTLVFRESSYHLEQCVFDRCNYHVDWLVLWGDAEALGEFKALATMLEEAQREGQKNPASTPQPK